LWKHQAIKSIIPVINNVATITIGGAVSVSITGICIAVDFSTGEISVPVAMFVKCICSTGFWISTLKLLPQPQALRLR